MDSPIRLLMQRLAAHPDPRGALTKVLAELTPLQLAHIKHDWRGLWARPKQLPPDTAWRSFGLMTGRGFGKTRTLAEFITGEIQGGPVRRVGICAQNEDQTYEIMIAGRSGLMAVAPPWFKPVFQNERLEYPNGAVVMLYTPQVPDDIRGDDVDYFWASELAAWPASTRAEAWSNIKLMTRQGNARVVWDSTPKRRNPLLKELLERAERSPARHIVIRGSTMENADNLGAGVVQEWLEEYGSTQQGHEELYGEFIDSSDGAMVRQEWIDAARRTMPERLERRVIALDPAISTRHGSDRTGVLDVGLGTDRQLYVIADKTGKYQPHEWAKLALDMWAVGRCDCVVIERNRGGDTLIEVLRGSARQRGWQVNLVKPDARTHHTPGTVLVKEVNARGGKAVRAEGTATAYERGLVSHVIGADLSELEAVLTTWEPSPNDESPDALDALVHAVRELGVGALKDPGITGLVAAAQAVRKPAPQAIPQVAIPRAQWGSKL